MYDFNDAAPQRKNSGGGEVIPFGKYKGRPVEEIAMCDPQYIQWLMGQAWFGESYGALKVTINNFAAEPEHTPEHNAMQAAFLDDRLRWKVVKALTGKGPLEYAALGATEVHMSQPEFEVKWGDVFWYSTAKWHDGSSCPAVFLECKPSIGDDYPAVLRKAKSLRIERTRGGQGYDWSSGYNLIFYVGEYVGSGATKEQFVKMFELSGFRVFFRRDVEALSV